MGSQNDYKFLKKNKIDIEQEIKYAIHTKICPFHTSTLTYDYLWMEKILLPQTKVMFTTHYK